jgi:glycosyltransferase involved in cell wall biosynthesis
MVETLRRLRQHELHLYEIDRGAGDAESRAAGHECVDVVHRVALALHRLPSNGLEPATAVAQAIATEKRIATAIDAAAFDVVLVHPSMHLQAPSLLTALRTPTLFYAHEARRLSYDAGYIAARRRAGRRPTPRRLAASVLERSLRRKDRLAVQAATAIACNSRFTGETIQRVYNRTATVCLPGVDRTVFSPAEAPRAQPPYVLAVGALDPVKGHDMVVEAVAQIPTDIRPKLHVVYERAVPGEAERLTAVASRRGVVLRLHKGVGDPALAALYRSATATVCASRMEPFGLTALESLSTGTPVVAVAEGGFLETVREGEGGVLVEPTAAGVAAGIRRVLLGEVPTDPLRIRATVAEYTWDRTAACLETALTLAASRREE